MPDEHQKPDPADQIPEIETPLIDMQDLEHKPSPETRVNTKGIAVRPERPSTRTDESDSGKGS